ncbi:hypothetical protein CCHR01_04124 [Colletotrichum chrysophilum]|uniref:Uncharacterized protein n=1 Tax=Colletotrichum chrysophilum TaxID=1836956 RepID=A0AAD9ATG1_9PEZI|nr:hypothetical protein CCHR01_04124 [Colletotrichum chrysophilum]
MYRDVAALVRAAAPAIWLRDKDAHVALDFSGSYIDLFIEPTSNEGLSVSHAVNRHNILPPVRSLLYQVIIATTHHEAVYQDKSQKCAPLHSSHISAPRSGSPVSRVNLSPQTITLAGLNEEVLTPRNPVNEAALIPPKLPATIFQFCKNLHNGKIPVDVESCVCSTSAIGMQLCEVKPWIVTYARLLPTTRRRCVDLRQDNRNCGKCNNECGLRESCVDSKCVPRVLEKPENQTAPANGTDAAYEA